MMSLMSLMSMSHYDIYSIYQYFQSLLMWTCGGVSVVVGGPGWRATAHWHPWWNYCDLRGCG
jgi:hypothetical protein